jgi:hypothetical protein
MLQMTTYCRSEEALSEILDIPIFAIDRMLIPARFAAP